MANTPAEWLAKEQRKTNLMAEAARPIDYLRCGEGHTWLLVQFDGLRALIQYCATENTPHPQGQTTAN